MAVKWSRRARDDLAAIFEFIARDNRDAAARWVGRLIERGESTAELPRAGRIVPEDGDEVRILTVFEGHRLLRASELTGDRDDEG